MALPSTACGIKNTSVRLDRERLYFAVKREKPGVVWMINPMQLKVIARWDVSTPPTVEDLSKEWEHDPTWVPQRTNENIRGAWENDKVGLRMPLPILPSHVHDRMRSLIPRNTGQR